MLILILVSSLIIIVLVAVEDVVEVVVVCSSSSMLGDGGDEGEVVGCCVVTAAVGFTVGECVDKQTSVSNHGKLHWRTYMIGKCKDITRGTWDKESLRKANMKHPRPHPKP